MLEHEDLSWEMARLVKCQTRINNNNGEKQQLEKENEVAQITNDGELMERTGLFDKQFLQNVADIVKKVWNMGSKIFKPKKEALKERTRIWKSDEHWKKTKKLILSNKLVILIIVPCFQSSGVVSNFFFRKPTRTRFWCLGPVIKRLGSEFFLRV